MRENYFWKNSTISLNNWRRAVTPINIPFLSKEHKSKAAKQTDQKDVTSKGRQPNAPKSIAKSHDNPSREETTLHPC